MKRQYEKERQKCRDLAKERRRMENRKNRWQRNYYDLKSEVLEVVGYRRGQSTLTTVQALDLFRNVMHQYQRLERSTVIASNRIALARQRMTLQDSSDDSESSDNGDSDDSYDN